MILRVLNAASILVYFYELNEFVLKKSFRAHLFSTSCCLMIAPSLFMFERFLRWYSHRIELPSFEVHERELLLLLLMPSEV